MLDAPHAHKNVHVLTGYVRHRSLLHAFTDLFGTLHNETMNVLTGVMGIPLGIYLLLHVHALVSSGALDAVYADRIRFWIVGCIVMSGVSSCYHLFLSIPAAYHIVSAMDISIIAALSATVSPAMFGIPHMSAFASWLAQRYTVTLDNAAVHAEGVQRSASGVWMTATGAHAGYEAGSFNVTAGLIHGCALLLICGFVMAVRSRMQRESPFALIALCNCAWMYLIPDFWIAQSAHGFSYGAMLAGCLYAGMALYVAKVPERFAPRVHAWVIEHTGDERKQQQQTANGQSRLVGVAARAAVATAAPIVRFVDVYCSSHTLWHVLYITGTVVYAYAGIECGMLATAEAAARRAA